MAKEQCSPSIARSVVTEISGNRPAGGNRQRHNVHSMTLTSNPDSAGVPVEIIKLQASYLDSAQSQVMQAPPVPI